MAPLPTSTLEALTHILLPRSPAESTPSPTHKPTSTSKSTFDLIPSSAKHDFGAGARPPKDINNNFFLILFALIGSAAALAGIWFFFWAKNGGFKWHKDDWDDYKSTVLRRKGPDGKTLSNATKSTKLGGGSVVHGQKGHRGKKGKGEKSVTGSSMGYTDDTYSSYADDPRREGMRGGGGSEHLSGRPSHSNRRADDLADYRHEKPARVGGLNREHDGSHFDYSNQSDLSQSRKPLVSGGRLNDKDKKKREKAEKAAREKARKETEKREKAEAKQVRKADKTKPKDTKKSSGKGESTPMTQTKDFANSPTTPKRAQPSGAYSFTPGDEEGSSHYTGPSQGTQEGSYYYSSYRPVATSSPQASPNNPHAQRYRDRRSQEQSRSANGSPSKRTRQSSRDVGGGGSSNGASSDVGTKVYSHHIPGLSKGTSEIGVDESVSQVGARRATGGGGGGGYRRTGLGGGGGVRRRDSLSDSE